MPGSSRANLARVAVSRAHEGGPLLGFNQRTVHVRKRIAAILIPLALLVLVGAGVVVVNQAFQLITLVDRLHPVAGDVAFWSLVALFGFCVGVPVFILLTLPPPLVPPASAEGAAFDRHIGRLQKRLAKNPHVSGAPKTIPEIDATLAQLDVVADARTKAAASQVFMTTAISQNGSLDALLVLAAQTKLVLEIARVYYQRPTLRDLLYLYSNVAATAFIAAELEDIDLSEQIQPILTAVLGSSVAAIPGMSAAAGLFVNSVTTGAGNAYLTLRVGIITRQYCRSLVRPERRTIRHAAAVQAARLLGGIAREGAASVAAAIWSRPRKYFAEVINTAGTRVSAIGEAALTKTSSAWNALTRRGRGPEGDTP